MEVTQVVLKFKRLPLKAMGRKDLRKTNFKADKPVKWLIIEV